MSWGRLSIVLIGLLPLTGCSHISQGVGMDPFIANTTGHTVTVRKPVFFLYGPGIGTGTAEDMLPTARLGCPDGKPYPYVIPSTDRRPWFISFALFTNIRHALSGSRTLEEAAFRIVSQTAYWDFVYVCRKHPTSEKITLANEEYPLPVPHEDEDRQDAHAASSVTLPTRAFLDQSGSQPERVKQ